MRVSRILTMVILTVILSAFTAGSTVEYQKVRGKKGKITKVWLIGDSTVADYSLEKDYSGKRYPIMGWGQVFQAFMSSDSLKLIRHLVTADSVQVDDRARGGRSTRSFFEEGRWSEIYRHLSPGDLVLIQFGHNDASVNKGERYTSLTGYKEFLRLYVSQAREKGAIPVLVTPVARNYPWKEGRLGNTHGDYPAAMRAVASETGAYLIDLTELSMEFFTGKGQDYVSMTYFMNFPPGIYQGYPDGSSDNTHFQPAGATAVAQLVYTAMKNLEPVQGKVPAQVKPAEGVSASQPLPAVDPASSAPDADRPAETWRRTKGNLKKTDYPVTLEELQWAAPELLLGEIFDEFIARNPRFAIQKKMVNLAQMQQQ